MTGLTLTPFSDLTPFSPMRLMRYVVFWCEEGETHTVVDSKPFILRSGDLITITSGQYHGLDQLNGATGYMLHFSYDFFCKDDFDIELVFQNGLFCHFDENEVIRAQHADVIKALFGQIGDELSQQSYQFEIVVHSLVKRLLIEINRSKLAAGASIWKPNALFLKFLELIRAHFDHSLPVRFYAEQLASTEYELNELARQHAGKTALMVIHGLITSEAKRRFLYEKKSVKEVAASLGFSDPFYFSNFFKKHSGVSPSAFQP